MWLAAQRGKPSVGRSAPLPCHHHYPFPLARGRHTTGVLTSGGAQEGDSVVLAHGAELCVFRQEAIAGEDGVAAWRRQQRAGEGGVWVVVGVCGWVGVGCGWGGGNALAGACRGARAHPHACTSHMHACARARSLATPLRPNTRAWHARMRACMPQPHKP